MSEGEDRAEGAPAEGAAPGSPLARCLVLLHRVEDGVLALVLGAMVLLAPAQIVLRTSLFDTSLPWADPLLRVMVLWVGLLGALAATRGDRQISIDVLSPVLHGKARSAVKLFTSLFASAISLLVAWASWQFIQTEIEFETTAFADVPAWMTEIIIPISFALIGLRYFVAGLGHGTQLLPARRGASGVGG